MNFDLVIIGSGPAGYIAAIRATQLGLKTALVEKHEQLGGTCLNVGCIPTKALLDSSELFALAKKSFVSHGIDCSPKLNLEQMMSRKKSVITTLQNGIDYLMKKNKISVFVGVGKIKSPQEVEVIESSSRQKEAVKKPLIIKTKFILLATGSTPKELPSLPFDKKNILSSTEALSQNTPPKSLVVIGGGVVGLEIGSIWSRLGTPVTIIELNSTIAAGADKQIAQGLEVLLKNQGLNILKDTKISSSKIQKNLIAFEIENTKTKEKTTVQTEKVLVSVGRSPYTKGLGLESLNIQKDNRGHILVNEYFETSAKDIYAVGDLIGGAMLAHKAEMEGIAAVENIASKVNKFAHKGIVNYFTVPSVIYTEPEAASVGFTEEELKAQNYDYKKSHSSFAANGRAQAAGFTEGFVKILSDKKTRRILGLHVLGHKASEIVGQAVVAMEFSATLEDLEKCFYAHPTLSETIKEACLS